MEQETQRLDSITALRNLPNPGGGVKVRLNDIVVMSVDVDFNSMRLKNPNDGDALYCVMGLAGDLIDAIRGLNPDDKITVSGKYIANQMGNPHEYLILKEIHKVD